MRIEPSFRIPARWIEPRQRADAVREGLTVVDVETVLTTHLSETVKAHMSQLMSYAATQKLLDGLGTRQPEAGAGPGASGCCR